MLASGNGAPQRCALNLMRTIRGEVPYARAKGIDREIVDSPATEGWRLKADVDRVLKGYEPRVSYEDVSIMEVESMLGDFAAVAEIEGGEDG